MQTDPLVLAVEATFAELGTGNDTPISRTVLLRDGYFVGHCFRCGDFRAIWKADSTVIEFFGADGELLRTVNPVMQEKRDAA
jgi:hypothetical protein